jgi:PleD family two-component response regulator
VCACLVLPTHASPRNGDLNAKIAKSLKEKVEADIEFKDKEVKLILEWMHDRIWDQCEVGVFFVFRQDIADKRKSSISIKVKKSSTYEEVLTSILAQVGARYVVRDDFIYVEKAEPRQK